MKQSSMEFSASQRILRPLKACIIQQIPEISFEVWDKQIQAKSEIYTERHSLEVELAKDIQSFLPNSLQQSMALAQEKGA